MENSSPPAPAGNRGEKRWWKAKEQTNNEAMFPVRNGMGQAQGWQESSDEVSTVGAVVTVRTADLSKKSSSVGFDVSAIKPYVPGRTDTIDQYLGAWDKIERNH